MFDLDERKSRILNAIIKNYLETGEPVGSRTISKLSDLNLSSATIRNEMSDLEDLGYIIQPYTSAGRIPSDKGYRFYVDHMMEEKDREIDEMKTFVIEHTEKMERVLKDVAKLLATNTNYATMISAPTVRDGKVKFIQLSYVDDTQVLSTIVLDGNIVKNKLIRTEHSLETETILRLNLLLNTTLNGLTLDQINLATIAQMKEQAGIHSAMVSDILDAVVEAIQVEEELEIYTNGATNIFKYPELSDSQKASELIAALEDKNGLKEFLVNTGNEDDGESGIQVYIGSESPIEEMRDCRVVTATYELADGMKGRIGIVGPKRMDYEKVVSNLKVLKAQLDHFYKDRER